MKSLKGYITPSTIASQLLLLRSGSSRARKVLLLEGENDYKIFQPFLFAKCDILSGDGKSGNLDAAAEVAKNDSNCSQWLRLIVDADYDRIDGNRHPSYVLTTEHHDIDTDLFVSDALHKVIANYCKEERCQSALSLSIRTHLPELADRVRSTVARSALLVGRLRHHSLLYNCELGLKDLDYSKVTRKNSIEIDNESLSKHVVGRSVKPAINEAEVKHLLQNFPKDDSHRWQYCQGHDLIALLAIGIRKSWGAHESTGDIIAAALRIGYEASWFWASQLGLQLEDFMRA